MKCEEIRNLMTAVLRKEADGLEIDRFNEHLRACPSCREEMDALRSIWRDLETLPEEAPSPALGEEFHQRMERELERIERPSPTPRPVSNRNRGLFSRFTWQPAWQFAATLLLLGIGFTGGYLYQNPPQKAIMANQQETESIRRELSLTQLSQPSAGERLAGVRHIARLTRPDDQMIGRLLDIVDNDENLQVRLAAVEALYLFGHRPEIRRGVAASLKKQDSPLMQVALMDLLVAWREKRAADSLKALVEDGRVDPLVQERAKESLEKLL